ncbi:MAG: undecaprenyl-diphosphate phosphatase [Eubacterium sp.]|nr:undecaprenyl-diphosphate phosphatase [Eubacterium sp.]
MSIITAIFQAILQAITYIIPISQSGHATVFHDFAGRADGTVTQLTGAVNIGIAIGIFAATYKLVFKLAAELFNTGKAVVQKDFSYKNSTNTRKLVIYLLISFVPMLLWLIPIGKYGSLYTVLKATAYNNTLLDDGVFFAVLGALIFVAARQLGFERNNRFVSLPAAITVGVCSVFFVPVSGLALIGGVFAALVLFGVSGKLALKYGYLMSVPVLLITGIVQLCSADYKSSIAAIVIGIVLSAPVAFLCVRILGNVVKKGLLKYISYYDFSIGLIVAVIGAIQLIVR